MWTLGDPKKAPVVIAAYRRACEEASRPAGEVVVQGVMSRASSDDAALDGSREWKGTLVDED